MKEPYRFYEHIRVKAKDGNYINEDIQEDPFEGIIFKNEETKQQYIDAYCKKLVKKPAVAAHNK